MRWILPSALGRKQRARRPVENQIRASLQNNKLAAKRESFGVRSARKLTKVVVNLKPPPLRCRKNRLHSIAVALFRNPRGRPLNLRLSCSSHRPIAEITFTFSVLLI